MTATALILEPPAMQASFNEAVLAVDAAAAPLTRPKTNFLSFSAARARKGYIDGFRALAREQIAKLEVQDTLDEWAANARGHVDTFVDTIRRYPQLEIGDDNLDMFDAMIANMIELENKVSRTIVDFRQSLRHAAKAAPEIADECEALWIAFRTTGSRLLDNYKSVRWYSMTSIASIEPSPIEAQTHGKSVSMAASDFAAAVASANAGS